MAKICPECGTNNKGSSEFCKKCGAFLNDIKDSTSGGLSWWDRQMLLIRAYPAIILVPIALILILSGLMLGGSDISSPSSTFTVGNVTMTHYSGNGFSFDFPSNWKYGDVSSTYQDITFGAFDDNLMCLVVNGTVGNNNVDEFKPLKEQYSLDYNNITRSWEGIQIKKEDINQNGVEGFRAVFKCNKSQLDDNKSTPAYIEEKLLIKGTEGRELYLVVATDYYEANKDVIDRIVELYSNPNEIVLTPFMGVGSEVYSPVSLGRKAIGIELKDSYFKQAKINLVTPLRDLLHVTKPPTLEDKTKQQMLISWEEEEIKLPPVRQNSFPMS